MPGTESSGFTGRFVRGQTRAYVVGALIVLAAHLVAFAFYRDGVARSRSALRNRAAAVAVAVEANLRAPIEAVRSIPPYFAASGLVEASEFRTFAEPMRSMHPSIVWVGFAPRVAGSERSTIETSARANGFADFAIRERYADSTLGPSRDRATYVPILYCEPGCPSLAGLDLSADVVDATAVNEALSGRRIVIVPRSSLRTGASGPNLLAVVAPLVGLDAGNPDPRVPRTGAAIVALDLDRALAPALATFPTRSMRFDLVEASAPDSSLAATTSQGDATETVLEERFRIHDREFLLRFDALEGAVAAGPLPAIVATAGMLLAIVTTLAILLASHAKRLRAEVQASRQLGPYRLIRRIGQGGMGTVYEAEHALLRRPTAVKMISDDRLSRDALGRFEREAKLTSQLTHPNTIVVFDFGRTPDGVFYYAMEYLRGFTLEDVVKTCGIQSPSRVVHLMKQIAGSLAEAHSVGLVHRDVKPANVMVCRRGGIDDFVKVLDFGLVKDLFGERQSSLSMVGQTLGTPRYMAPETFVDGEPPTPAADVYAVGAIAFLLLTGTELIEGSTMSSILMFHTAGTPVAPSTRLADASRIPIKLDALILRCLQRDPLARPKNGEELRLAFEACGVDAWTEDDARHARLGHDERFVEASGDFSGDDTLAVDSKSREHVHGDGHDGTRAA